MLFRVAKGKPMPNKKTTNFPECFRLEYKVAVITGGASGIGLASAKMLSDAGAIPVLIDLDKKNLDQAFSSLIPKKESYPGIIADVSDESQLKKNFTNIYKDLGRIDILVNCAGITIRKPATKLPIHDWNAVVKVNMTVTFLAARTAAKIMEKKKGGVIINTASIMGLSGGGIYPNISYQTTKGAIVNMTRAMAVEWASQNIRVNAIAPTYVRTPFIKTLLKDPKIIKKIKDSTPLRRLAEPEEIASAVLFLASPGASMITGHTLVIDGGFLAQ